MNRIFIIFLILLGGSHIAVAMSVRGIVKAGKEKLSGIIVTDGFNFVRTNEQGKFEMDTDERADFLYLLTPDGYVAPYHTGVPEFYLPLRFEQKEYCFDLISVGKSKNSVLIAIADVQTRNEEQFRRFQEQSIPDLKETIASYPDSPRIIGISLGDIVWDHFEHFPVYKKEMAALKIPFYPVIGNHDHDIAEDADHTSAHRYKEQFGPTYYAFQLKSAYFIVLDNIIYYGKKEYETALTKEQLEWVKGLLNFIPKGSRVVIATHSPFYFSTKGKIQGTEELFALLKDYKTDLISGHTHLNSNHEIAPHIIEHNLGAICGAWWTADLNRDGTPNGYGVFEISDAGMQWYYKSTGYSRSWQFKVFPQGTLQEKSECIIAKVWNWDPLWSVKWYEDGVMKGEMERFDSYDPDYLKYVEGQENQKYTQPVASFFYFFAKPSEKAGIVEIEVTDRFGHVYPRQKINR